MCSITVVILTLNEEKHIERCLARAFHVARQLLVVDSFSTDQTVTIAQSLGAQLWQQDFKTHSVHLPWARANLPVDTAELVRLEAD